MDKKYTVNISSDEAEGIKQLADDEVLISIHNTTNPDWNLQVSDDKVLKVYFDDVIFPCVLHNLPRCPINRDQANEIIDFLEKNKDKKVLVNCHAGISRSSAVCLFIHTCYGHQLKPNFWLLSEPNELVLGLLIKEYKRREPFIN